MLSRKKALKNCKLYLILDREVNSFDELFEILKQSVNAGVDIIQLRDKRGSAKDILEFSRKALRFLKGRIPYIINDRVDLAMIAGADGVHLGQNDIPLDVARKMMGTKAIIGTSCQSLSHARKAERLGADYIGFGSVFKTLTKPERSPMDLELLKTVVQKIRTPVFVIGGIGVKNVEQLCSLGVERIAVCRAICQARDIKKTTKSFKDLLKRKS